MVAAVTTPALPLPFPVRVYHEDTDAGGVVYHANYLRFLERARTEWLRHLGFQHGSLAEEENVVFVVRAAKLKFLRPARLDDHLRVTTALAGRRAGLLAFQQEIWRHDAELLRADLTVACIDATTQRACALPEKLSRALGVSV